ncbi:hypothetical protein BP6252_01974 [Coleophoma cylindrospora]|uniref:Uncharacterized protein n=1 Tax=Coleophoma cylindrospora TaxID=1849047 RepID=A0A3D8SE62_9HELO|nr:hypothetical protein BP6252_01974 [Coleophoma cylindrospora]
MDSGSKHEITTTSVWHADDSLNGSPCPAYDKANTTRQLCILGISISWIVSIICVGLGLHTLVRDPEGGEAFFPPMSKGAHVAIPLALNVAVSFCTDCLGYVHSTSLRWALWHEGRLAFTSNLRIFTSSKSSWPNRWHSNLLGAISLIACYTATSQILMPSSTAYFQYGSDHVTRRTSLNGVAVLALGLGILFQAIISTACLASHPERILTWSSSPFTITLASLQNGLQHRDGRCMMSAESANGPTIAVEAKTRQPSSYRTDRSVRYIVSILWVLFALCLLWAVVVLVVNKHVYGRDDFSPSLFAGDVWFGVTQSGSLVSEHAITLFLIGAWQALVTLSTHVVELLVNRSRDEGLWRKVASNTGSSPGTNIRYNSFVAALSSWQTLTLFTFKPIIHWVFGLGLYQEETALILVEMSYLALFLLSVVTFFLAVFGTSLALQRPKGNLPSSWGHVQTLADLVDDWADGTRLYWGDKGINNDGTRHAGTSGMKESVGEIQAGCCYS